VITSTVAVTVAVGVAAAVLLVVSPGGSSAAGDRVAWFETPTDGDRVTTGQVTIVAGATDAVGIAVLELSVNGEFVEGRLYEGAPERVVAEFAWRAGVEGDLRLTVRARGTDGVWGARETIVVTAAHHYRSEEALSPQTSTTVPATTTTRPAPRPTTTTTSAPTTTTSAPTTTAPPVTSTTTSTTGAGDGCEATAPSLQRPRDQDEVSESPVLVWGLGGDSPCQPDLLRLEFLGPTENGDALLIELPPWATSWQTPHLDDCSTFTWQVTAVAEGEEHRSATRTFTTDFDEEC
jgi:hypothetical protein